MTPEEKILFDRLDPLHQTAIVIFQALLAHQTPPGETSQSLDPKISVDACLLVVAALIEVDSGAETTRGLREALDAGGARLKVLAKKFRQEYEATGKRGMEQLGALALRRERIN